MLVIVSTSQRYEIEIGGRASDRVLRPLIDEFTVEPTGSGTTRCTGTVRDSSHLYGLLAHFASLDVEVIGLRRLDAPDTHSNERHSS